MGDDDGEGYVFARHEPVPADFDEVRGLGWECASAAAWSPLGVGLDGWGGLAWAGADDVGEDGLVDFVDFDPHGDGPVGAGVVDDLRQR